MSSPPSFADDRACGTCGMCCKVVGIQALAKPPGVWCGNFRRGRGCGVYAERPGECAAFECFWRLSRLGPEWRPDRCRFVMFTEQDGRRLRIEVDAAHPAAWRAAPFHAQIKAWSQAARSGERQVLVSIGRSLTVVFPEQDIALGPAADGETLVAGYDAAGRPYARYAALA